MWCLFPPGARASRRLLPAACAFIGIDGTGVVRGAPDGVPRYPGDRSACPATLLLRRVFFSDCSHDSGESLGAPEVGDEESPGQGGHCPVSCETMPKGRLPRRSRLYVACIHDDRRHSGPSREAVRRLPP